MSVNPDRDFAMRRPLYNWEIAAAAYLTEKVDEMETEIRKLAGYAELSFGSIELRSHGDVMGWIVPGDGDWWDYRPKEAS
jgi:hypothetical protein